VEDDPMKKALMLALALMAGGCAMNRSGLWRAEDCRKISDASGLFLYASGEYLEEADKLKKEGKEEEADKSYEGAFFLSELATNYAKNFEAYCK
jgi:hypothetical protein